MRPLGFSEDGLRNFIEMTEAVIAGKALPEKNGTIIVRGKTTLEQYLEGALQKK